MNYNDVQWVIQNNLSSEDVLLEFKKSCDKIGVSYVEIEVIPFTTELPYFSTQKRSLIYGSVTFNNLVYADPNLKNGIFFNDNFFMENYFKMYKNYMLNFDSKITSFRELKDSNEYGPDQLLFIRPNDDTKSFAGDIKEFKHIGPWYEGLKIYENTNLTVDTKIVVAEPFNLKKEWRLWIVNKKVVAASQYRKYFKLSKERGCPKDVIDFAEARCQEYTPHDVFVMDICLCGDELYIVECGCMNGSGFYHANIYDIVKETTNYFINNNDSTYTAK